MRSDLLMLLASAIEYSASNKEIFVLWEAPPWFAPAFNVPAVARPGAAGPEVADDACLGVMGLEAAEVTCAAVASGVSFYHFMFGD